MIIGQAPGKKVHSSGIPWDDASGNQLRSWLGVDRDTFYDVRNIALLPMGFCYPGKGKSGDLPPRPECAPTWHQVLLNHIPHRKFTLLVGQYAQHYYLRDHGKENLTETVRNYSTYLPGFFPIPHPSPRNRFWLSRNRWFGEEVLPQLKSRVELALLEQ